MKESFIKVPEIIYEDKHILAVNKPPGLVVQGGSDKNSLLKICKDYIKIRDKKPGNVFLGVVHRLDKPVSGVVIFAKRSKSAARIFKSFQAGLVDKIYLAVVEGSFGGEFLWRNYIKWNENKKRAEVFNEHIKNSKEAYTYAMVIKKQDNRTWLLLYPFTGRKHQLRVVLSHIGHPIIGDIKYGSKIMILKGKAILLHSFYLAFPHPISKEKIELIASPPEYFSSFYLDKSLILEFLNKIKLLKESDIRCVKQKSG